LFIATEVFMVQTWRIGAVAAALSGLALMGCGGGGGGTSTDTSTPSTTPTTVEGVATPNSVSVVTAKNAS
jgi:hypothetical protein